MQNVDKDILIINNLKTGSLKKMWFHSGKLFKREGKTEKS